MAAFAIQLALAVCESVVMAILKRFIPILRGALPPETKDTRADAIQRNRNFVAAFFQYLLVIVFVAMTFTVLPMINEIASGNPHGKEWAKQWDYTDLQKTKFVGRYLPNVHIPADFFSAMVWRASMIAVVPIMIITGLIFWPVWQGARSLGYDTPERRTQMHLHAVLVSLLIGVWLMIYLFTPLTLLGALLTFGGIMGVFYVISVVTDKRRRHAN